MKGGGGQQQASNDQVTSFFWLIGIAVGAILAMWFFKREWITAPIFWFRIHETYFLQWIAQNWDKIVAFFPSLHLPAMNVNELSGMREYMQTTPSDIVQLSAFSYINRQIGNWLSYPIIGTLLLMAGFVYFRHTSHRFQKVYNMEELKKQESQNWPEITPVLTLDLLKEDLDSGPWAMARLPLDFCKEHDMLTVGIGEEGKQVWKLNMEPAYRVFSLQVGGMWRGMQALPIYLKALMVIFLARALREREIANHFLKQIAASAGHGKLDFSGVEDQLKKYENCKPLKWLETRHAYVGTLMAALLEISRIDGVLATAEFLWLKPVDRRMWFMLNSVGRQTAVVEVAGLFAHWHAEKKLKRPLKNPMVKEAVHALDEEVQKILFIAESEKWQ